MKESNVYRTNVYRGAGIGMLDLVDRLTGSLLTYKSLVDYTSPLISKNTSNSFFYISGDELKDNVKRHHLMNPIMFTKMISSTVKHFKNTKYRVKLAEPHPLTHRSFQIASDLFTLDKIDTNEYLDGVGSRKRNYTVKSVHRVTSSLVDDFYIENLRDGSYSHLILRPKFGHGSAKLTEWEVVIHKTVQDSYLITHIDTDLEIKDLKHFATRGI